MLSSNLVRQTEATLVNKIVNDPSVYPWVCGGITGPLDFSRLIDDRNNCALFCDKGGVLFHCHQAGLYEAHTQFLPEGRGKFCLDMVQEALCWMFCHTDAVEILTRVPHGNIGAKALVRAIKGEYEFTNQKGWFYDGKQIPADIYSMRIQHWMNVAPWLPECGEWFHDRLEGQYAEQGIKHELHADDPVHDRYVGAAVAMILGGQVHKGAIFYNRWAVMAGYQPIQILTTSPLVIDIRDALLHVRDDTFWVI